MGGGDKVLQPLGGTPLLTHVIDILWPQVDALALNANGDPDRFQAFGLPVLPDPFPDQPGPLAGILAGMQWAQARASARILTVAGDTPFLPRNLAARLAAEKADVVMARHNGQLQPVIALWSASLAAAVAQSLAAGERGVEAFARTKTWAAVDFDGGPDPFLNINTAADLAAAEALIAAK